MDFSLDPPPDLAIEIDIAHTSTGKLSLYAAMGVPEVWTYDGRQVSIFVLRGEAMVLSNSSLAFPSVKTEALSWLMQQSRLLTRTAWNRKVREWAKSLQSPPQP